LAAAEYLVRDATDETIRLVFPTVFNLYYGEPEEMAEKLRRLDPVLSVLVNIEWSDCGSGVPAS